MKRVKLIVAYDGTGYCGWQVQPNEITVEGVLNKHISELTGEDIKVIGASRTDSGVHALGNVAVFDTESRIPGEKMAKALNARLPEDIIIQDSKEVPLDYHPRFQDTRKTYEYTFYNARYDNPVTSRHHHFVYVPLDVEKMKEAASYFLGEHCFISMCSSKAQVTSYVREIYECDVTQNGRYITMRVTGSGFLYNMVRIIAGTLLEVGMGAYPPEHMEEILDGRNAFRGRKRKTRTTMGQRNLSIQRKSYTRTKTSSKRLDINSDRISGGPRECRIALSYFRNC